MNGAAHATCASRKKLLYKERRYKVPAFFTKGNSIFENRLIFFPLSSAAFEHVFSTVKKMIRRVGRAVSLRFFFLFFFLENKSSSIS